MVTRKFLVRIIMYCGVSAFSLWSCLENDNDQIRSIKNAAFLRIFHAYENKEKAIANDGQRNGVGLLINKSLKEDTDTLKQVDAVIIEGISDRAFFMANTEPGAFLWDQTTSYPTINDLVPVAPISGSIDYYKWAAVRAGEETRLTFLTRVKEFGFAGDYLYPSSPLTDTSFIMTEDRYYSAFLIKNPTDTSKYKLHVIEDNFSAKQFNETKMYFRFINLNSDLPEELDIFYFATYGTGDCSPEGVTNGKCKRDTLFVPTSLGTIENKFPINGDNLPFFSIEVPEEFILRGGKPVDDGAIPLLSLWLYRKGENPFNGGVPLVSIGTDPFGGSISYPFLIPPAGKKYPYKRNSISNIVLAPNLPEPTLSLSLGFAIFDLERSNALDEYFKK